MSVPPHTHDASDADAPLPATLAFVLTIGAFIFVGWLLMFALLRSRW